MVTLCSPDRGAPTVRPVARIAPPVARSYTEPRCTMRPHLALSVRVSLSARVSLARRPSRSSNARLASMAGGVSCLQCVSRSHGRGQLAPSVRVSLASTAHLAPARDLLACSSASCVFGACLARSGGPHSRLSARLAADRPHLCLQRASRSHGAPTHANDRGCSLAGRVLRFRCVTGSCRWMRVDRSARIWLFLTITLVGGALRALHHRAYGSVTGTVELAAAAGHLQVRALLSGPSRPCLAAGRLRARGFAAGPLQLADPSSRISPRGRRLGVSSGSPASARTMLVSLVTCCRPARIGISSA
jgi:hypothetical protein